MPAWAKPSMPIRRAHRMPFGAQLETDGAVRFRVWAPSHRQLHVELVGSQPIPMEPIGSGWHELVDHSVVAGSRYQFVLPDGLRVPDPASRFQPDDVHGASEIIDPKAYA